MRVIPVPALRDNYLFLLHGSDPRCAAVLDPGEAGPVLCRLGREGASLEAILLTHHHSDHVGGVPELLDRFPGARVIGPYLERTRIATLTETVREGDTVDVLGERVRVLEVPGHTAGHVAYFAQDADLGGDAFVGDTLFGATIGNLFEGTPEIMYASLTKIRGLPAATRLWCGHEYTLQYVRDAARFEPDNPRVAERLRRAESAAARGEPSVPLSLAEEMATNPFLRWDDPALVARLGTAPGLPSFCRIYELL